MKTRPPAVRLLFFALGLCAITVRAGEPAKPDETQLRDAVTRSLAFLDKEADDWMNDKNCNGCHHMPELLWSHREARRRGFVIDPKMFDEFIDWSYSHAKETNAGLEMVALMKLAMPERPAPELAALIVKSQQADGSWKPANQLADMQRRGAPDATENAARLFLLALGTQKVDEAATEEARVKAAALLARSDPATSLETLVFRTLYAQRFGSPEEAVARRAEIRRLQHADGGWSYIVGEEQSDSLATGEALYLLQQMPEPTAAEAAARAQHWLVGHQREDGGWFIDITRISRIDRSTPEKSKDLKDATAIYTFWGSAWATIGLVQGFPLTDSQDAKAP